ncbi:hypothetical protein BGZ93_000648 [Podila epicladia]|nr:hypothetical protein BGZ93_000648 [Podila epicladia]
MYARSFTLLVLATLAVIGSMAEASIAPTFNLEKRKFCFTDSCCVPACKDPKYVTPELHNANLKAKLFVISKQIQLHFSFLYQFTSSTYQTRFATLAAVSVVAATIFAVPASLVKRCLVRDIATPNFAPTLEYLGAEFYRCGLAKSSQADFRRAGCDGKVRDRYVQIGYHESTHVTYLTNAIRSLHNHPVPPCKFKLPLNNLAWFVAVSQTLENTGTSAYLGAVANLEGDLLTPFRIHGHG